MNIEILVDQDDCHLELISRIVKEDLRAICALLLRQILLCSYHVQALTRLHSIHEARLIDGVLVTATNQ